MFSRITNRCGALVALVGVMFLGSVAHAASVSATSSITDLSVSLLTLSNDQYLSDASTPMHSGFDTGSTLQNYFFNDGNSFASIDNSFAPLPQTSAGAIGNGRGSATVLWSFDWTATSTGTATVNLEYLYNATVQSLSPGEIGIASSSVSALVDGTQVQSDALRFFNNENGDTSGFDNLVLNFAVTAGQTGTVTVALVSNALVAPVPLPAALWLFGSGLAGLSALRRRRTAPTTDVVGSARDGAEEA